jgi:hypothetical protein
MKNKIKKITSPSTNQKSNAKMVAYSVSEKALLENAIETAVQIYLEQEHLLKKSKVRLKIKEEALRYLIVAELSKIKIFGQFPAKNPEKFILIQHTYNTLKRGKRYQYPDIASLGKSRTGDYNWFLAVEIKNSRKQNNSADLTKCFGYVSEEKGREKYQLALCVNFNGRSLIREAYISTRGQGNVLFTTVDNYGDPAKQKIEHIWCKKQ